MKTQLTLDSMLSELTSIVAGDLARLSALYGPLDGLDHANIDSLPVTQSMRRLFDYAINARLVEGTDLSEVLHECTDFFLEVVRKSAMIEMAAPDPFTGVCATIVERSIVRWGLDTGEMGTFTIKDIAILASMDERSVRNAASPKLPKPLKTFTDSEGTTRVERTDVLAWLEDRRGFMKTVTISPEGGRAIPLDGFSSLMSLSSFIQSACVAVGRAPGDVVAGTGVDLDHPAWSSSGGQPFAFEPAAFGQIAKALSLSTKPFVIAACKTFQRAELIWLEQTLQS